MSNITYTDVSREAIHAAAEHVRTAYRREHRKNIAIVCLSVLLLAAIAAGCIIAVAAIRAA